MKLHWIWAGVVCCTSLMERAHCAPSIGQDYYSLQIASAPDARGLEKVFGQYMFLPYVRIERRDALFVLRAGFWPDLSSARAALEPVVPQTGLLRVATYRPPAIIRKNWEATEPGEASVATTTLESPVQTVPRGGPNIASERPSSVLVERAEGESLRPFDAQDFALAFDVLVGAGDLRRAFEVAQKAVQSVPHDRAWRMRLAKVSQWVQRPDIMAEQWFALFQQGDHSPDTVAKVIEWAPLADRPLVALQAWAVYARMRTLSDAQWQDILALYESAAEPVQGSVFFAEQFKRTQRPLLLEYAARLAENAGDDPKAESLYLQRAGLEPFSLDSVLHAVVSLVRRGKMREALVVMQDYESRIPADALEYWRLLSQVAWELRDYDVARHGYERYARLPAAISSDWSRLIFLVRRQHPDRAADLAIEAYTRFGLTDQLLLGLGIYAELGDMVAQARVFAMLGERAELLAAKETRFLLLRSQFYQKQKNVQAAWGDLRRALDLAPDDGEVLLATVWFLIDFQRTADLSVFLRSYRAVAENQPFLWAGFAAANQLLERHREAAGWYDRIVKAKADDPLILLNYADARERMGQHGMADRLRRHAWLQLRSRYSDPGALRTLGQSSELLAFARLSLTNQPGDPGLGLVRQLVSQLRGLSAVEQDSQTVALVLGWAVVKEQFHNARSWMWRRYAQQSQSQAPLWGQSQVALKLDDRLAMEQLLLRSSDALPIYNRYDVAYAMGHRSQAIDIAFKGMEPQEDEPLYERYRQHVPLVANYIQFEGQAERGSEIDSNRLHFETRLAVTSQVFLFLSGSTQQQAGSDPIFAALAPGRDQLGRAEIQWMGPRGSTSVTLFHRDALSGWTGLRLDHSYQWDARLNLDTTLSYHAESLISQPMRVAGYEDTVSVNLSYALGRREYVRVAPRFSTYYTQFGDLLGSSQSLDVETGYRFRTEYPDWRVRAFAKYLQFSRVDTMDERSLTQLPVDVQTAVTTGSLDPVAYFIPDSSTRAGVCVDMGENLGGQNLQTNYSKAWRPFVNACLSHDTVAGPGFNAVIGVAGSVTGEDHLRMQWESTQAMAPAKGSANTLTLRYRHYY